MSLINQMLKDLDKRNATSEGVQPLSGDVRSVITPHSTSFLPLLALVVAVTAAGAVTWLKYVKPGVKPEIVAPQVVALSSPVPAKPAVSAPQPAAAARTTSVPASAVPELVSAVSAAADAVPPLKMDKAMDKPLAAVKDGGSASVENKAVQKSTPGKSEIGVAEESKAAPAKLAANNSTADMSVAEAPKHEKPVSKARDGQPVSMKVLSPQQRSDNFYRQAVAAMQQGRAAEAKEDLRKALSENPLNHTARQLLVGLLVEDSHQGEAIDLLQDGLKLAPNQTRYALVLARLQVEAGDRQAGMATLESELPLAGNDPEYHAFLAALMQREERHDAAVEHYLVALKSDPAMPNWLVGIGISLQALGRTADATEAYIRAQDSGMLPLDLQQFVDQRLRQIKK